VQVAKMSGADDQGEATVRPANSAQPVIEMVPPSLAGEFFRDRGREVGTFRGLIGPRFAARGLAIRRQPQAAAAFRAGRLVPAFLDAPFTPDLRPSPSDFARSDRRAA
jgi:hypothetical protein